MIYDETIKILPAIVITYLVLSYVGMYITHLSDTSEHRRPIDRMKRCGSATCGGGGAGPCPCAGMQHWNVALI
jgi:hypothetical protein